MSRIRVAHFGKYLPPVVGGMETSIYQICESLSKTEDLDIRLVGSNTRNRRESQRLSDHFEMTKLACAATIFSTPILRGVKTELASYNPDIAHLHLPNPYLSWALGPLKKPLVITYHCEILTYPTVLKAYEPILTSTLKSAARIIATSQQLIDHSPFLKTFERKCSVVPLGIKKESDSEPDPRVIDQIHAQYGKRIILFVGRLVTYKGLRHLIEAMTRVDGRLLLIGTGPLLESLRLLVESLGLTSKVAFLGKVSDTDLNAFYSAARVVTLTSIDEREAFGMCLVEALSHGRPLVTTKVPSGMQFVNRDGYTGFQVEVGDVKAISVALSKLLDDDLLWQKFSLQANLHFKENFEINNVARAYRQIYKEVL